jgi:hypothetical protein
MLRCMLPFGFYSATRTSAGELPGDSRPCFSSWGRLSVGLQLSQTVYVHAPRPLLVELANAADDAKALLAIIQSGEARLAVALAVVEGDPSPENDGGGEEVAALHSRRSIRRGAAGAGPTIRRVMQ